MNRLRGSEHGFAAIELSAGVALLVLPVVLLVVSLPRWSERQEVARGAAREAARVVALAGWCDVTAAEQVVARAASAAGYDRTGLRLSLDCTAAGPLPRGGAVTARVAVGMPALAVPGVGTAGGWSWTAQHREPVDPYLGRP